MCGRPSTTIGFERRFNPVLKLSRDDFVRITAEVAARPLNMTAILATNQGRADFGWVQEISRDQIPAVAPEQAHIWLRAHEATVVDVREPDEYIAGHIPGAISIPQADLAVRLEEVPRQQDLLLACRSGLRSLASARFLKSVGYERVTNLDGGTLGWIHAGYAVVMGWAPGGPLPRSGVGGQRGGAVGATASSDRRDSAAAPHAHVVDRG